MRLAFPAALLACLTLGACATPRPADTRLPTAFETLPDALPRPANPPSGAMALDQWWLAFNDPQLNRLIDQTLVNNPDARTAVARLREAGAIRAEALVHYLPQGDPSASTRRTDTKQLAGTVFSIPGFSSSGVSTVESANFNVTWEVDIFGRFFATRKAVNADLAAVRFNYEGTRASLAAQVADTYFTARGLAIQLLDAREAERIETDLYDTTVKRAQAGLAPTSDSDRVAGDLAQSRAAAASLEAQLQVQRRALLVLAGHIVDPTSDITLDTTVGKLPPMPDALPSQLLVRRPDVREAQARVAATVGRENLDMLAFLPTLTFAPGLGWQKQTQPGFSLTAQSVITGWSVIQPLLSAPRLLAELKAQNARTEQAVIAYEKSVQTAFQESEAALVLLDSDRRRVALLTDGEARALRAYQANRIGYGHGIIDLDQTLTSEQSWRQIRAQLTASQVQAARRMVQAYKAIGGGWPAEQYSPQAQAR